MDSNRWTRLDAALECMLDGQIIELDEMSRDERALLERLAEAAVQPLHGLDTPAAHHAGLTEALEQELNAIDALPPGHRVGPFRLVRKIGSGGMGVVFLAERADGVFDQQVALKLRGEPRGDVASLRLFERERKLLARLEHPNIARLIDGGVTDDQRPWFAMEFIDGEQLLAWADRQRLSVKDRLTLFLQICSALEHAHRRLILHRDLKPANLLVDRGGRAKLVDFGLGSLLEPDVSNAHETLAQGRMTPAWASPEQARGEPITTRSEVFQLGLVLYRLLTDCAPYNVESDSAWAIAQTITEARVGRPSETWRSGNREDDADLLGSTPPQLQRTIAGDLDNIVLKALSSDPAKRYAGVDALADDLRRHLRREPVHARAATRRYRFGRFVLRNRAAVTGAVAFSLLLLGSVIVFALQSQALQTERDRAVAAAARSERVVDAMAGMIRLSDADNPVEQLYSLGDLLNRYVNYVRSELDQDPAVRARLLGILGQALYGIDRWDQAQTVIDEAVAAKQTQRTADDIEVLGLKRMLAEAIAHNGDLPAAVSLLDEIETIAALRDGNTSEAVADTIYLRGFLQAHFGVPNSQQHLDGLADLENALALYRSQFDAPHAKIAAALHAFGFKLQDPSRRLATVQEGLDMTRKLLGRDHPVYAMRLAELALVHDLDGNYGQAARIGAEAYDIHARIQGETHPETLTILNNLAGSYREAGNLDRAIELYRQMHVLREQVLPPDHLLLAYTAHGLGNTLRQAGQHAESERWLREALRLCRLHDSRNEAVTRVNLSRTLMDAGRPDEAIVEQTLAIEAFVKHDGENSESAQAARQRLSELRQTLTPGA